MPLPKSKQVNNRNLALLYCLFLITPFAILSSLRLMEFDGLYGQDSYEYLRYAKAIHRYITDGIHPNSFYWPVLYPTIGSLLSFILPSTAFALQFTTGLSLSIICIFLHKTLILTNGKSSSIINFYIFSQALLSPYLLKSSLVAMSDTTAAMFIVLAYYYYLRSKKNIANTSLTLFFATCAVMTRYPCLVVTFPIIVHSLQNLIKRRAYRVFLLGAILSTTACLPHLILQAGNLYMPTSNYFLNSWSIQNYFQSYHTTVDGIRSYQQPNLIFVLYVFLHPGFIFTGIFLSMKMILDFSKSSFSAQRTLFACIFLYLAFLAGIPFQNIRVLGLIFPLVLLLLYPSYLLLVSLSWVQKHRSPLVVLCILIQLALWCFTFRHVYQRTITEKQIASLMQPYEGNTLYSFDFDISLQGRGLDFDYKSMYDTIYSNYSEGELILFNPEQLEKQWKGKGPMVNWSNIKSNYQLEVLETFENNWNLFRIMDKN